jgi:hypothetical protein
LSIFHLTSRDSYLDRSFSAVVAFPLLYQTRSFVQSSNRQNHCRFEALACSSVGSLLFSTDLSRIILEGYSLSHFRYLLVPQQLGCTQNRCRSSLSLELKQVMAYSPIRYRYPLAQLLQDCSHLHGHYFHYKNPHMALDPAIHSMELHHSPHHCYRSLPLAFDSALEPKEMVCSRNRYRYESLVGALGD